MATLTKEQATAHGLIKQVNAHYKAFTEAQEEAIENATAIGELLIEIKELLPHGEFIPFVEQFFDFEMRWGQRCMKIAGGKEILDALEEKPHTVEDAIKAIADATPRKKQNTSSGRISPPSGKPPSQSEAPPADAEDDAEFNDHVRQPDPPKIKGGTSFDVANIEAAAACQTFAQRVQAHNLGIERLARAVAESIKELPESHELEKKQTVVEQQIQSVCGTIRTCKVHDKPCPKCEDSGKPCKVCGGCGMVTKMTYDGMGGK